MHEQCLDRNKLNSLQALVFAEFPLESSKEKEKIWQGIKAKINTKYQVGKLLTVQVN